MGAAGSKGPTSRDTTWIARETGRFRNANESRAFQQLDDPQGARARRTDADCFDWVANGAYSEVSVCSGTNHDFAAMILRCFTFGSSMCVTRDTVGRLELQCDRIRLA
jgi:hypothetical protein